MYYGDDIPKKPVIVTSRNPVTYELLVITAYALLFYGAVLLPGVFLITESMGYAIVSIFLMLPSFLFICIRRVNSFLLFIFSHFILCVITYYATFLLTRDINLTILFTAFVIYQVVFSATSHLSNGKIQIGNIFAAISIVMFFVSSYVVYKFTGVMIDVPQSVIVVGIIACCLFYTHIKNIDDVLSTASQNTVAPVESIVKFNNKVIALIISLITVAVLLSRFFFVDRLLLFLYSCLDKLLFFIASLIRSAEKPESLPEVEEITETLVLPDLTFSVNSGGGGAYAGGGSDIVNIILYVLVILIFIGIIAYLAYDFYKKYKELPLANPHKTESSDIKSFIVAEDTSSFSPFRAFTATFGLSDRQKARRLFYRKVKLYYDHKNVHFTSSDTSGEMCLKISEHENTAPLQNLYNKARYSSIELTKDDFNDVKQ